MQASADEVAMHGQAQDIDRRWFKRFGRTGDTARVRLLCFHHAGGTAAMYRQWSRWMPASVEPIAVQLPGRADRFGEPPLDRMDALVDELVDALKPLLDRPFSFYGISMGSRIAWALAHALRDRAMPQPSHLYIACDPAPVTDDGVWPWENRSDGLVGYLRDIGGTPAEVLAEPELLRALLPTVRTDLNVIATHDFHPTIPLDIPIRAFAGVDDPLGTPESMDAWRGETTAAFVLHRLPGGHFLTPEAEQQVVRIIVDELG